MVKLNKKLYNFTKHQVKDLLTYDVKDRMVYSKEHHLKLLLAASLVNGFAEGVSKSLNNSPTGETMLSYIKNQEQEKIQRMFDKLVEKNVKILKRKRKLTTKVPIAIDWHDVMYYGDTKTPMVIGTQHKKGSNYAFEYLTASVLVDGERLIVAVMPIGAKSEVSSLTTRLIHQIKKLGIRIRYITLDGGFFTIDVIRFLEESCMNYILHMPSTHKTKRMKLWEGRKFRYTTTDHKRKKSKQISFDVVVAYDEKKKYKYLLVTNMGYDADVLLKLFNKRWSIETNYRMSNQFLIKTTSKQYVVRLFYYLFACSIYNVWALYNENEHIIVVRMKLILIAFIMTELDRKERKIT